jgi:hypothetical protein
MQEIYYKNLKNNLNNKIKREYTNYFTKSLIYKLIEKKNNDNDNDKELLRKEKSYMESILYMRIGYQLYDKTPPYHPYKIISNKEKKEYFQSVYENIPYIDEIIKLIDDRFNYIDENYDPKITIGNKFIYLYKIKIPLDNRIRFLLNYARKMLKKVGKRLSLSKKLVTRCIVRYASLGVSGNQCSLSSDIYNYFYNNLNVRGEGFCSPLNSKLIEKEDTIICTIFKDIDKYFKSHGSFNDTIMLQNNHINWLLNPPFMSSTTKLSIKSIRKTLDESDKKMLIVLVIPLSKVTLVKDDIYNKYLYGYINQTDIEIGIKKIKRSSTKQYFLCNDKWSHNFENIYMYFYTNDQDINLENHMITLSDLWTKEGTDDPQQSEFRDISLII